MDRTFVHNVLSIMTITRVRQPDYPGWQAGRRGDPCPRLGFYPGLWNLYREYAGCSGIAHRMGICPKKNHYAAGSAMRNYGAACFKS